MAKAKASGGDAPRVAPICSPLGIAMLLDETPSEVISWDLPLEDPPPCQACPAGVLDPLEVDPWDRFDE